jgi:hypothetical protein
VVVSTRCAILTATYTLRTTNHKDKQQRLIDIKYLAHVKVSIMMLAESV